MTFSSSFIYPIFLILLFLSPFFFIILFSHLSFSVTFYSFSLSSSSCSVSLYIYLSIHPSRPIHQLLFLSFFVQPSVLESSVSVSFTPIFERVSSLAITHSLPDISILFVVFSVFSLCRTKCVFQHAVSV